MDPTERTLRQRELVDHSMDVRVPLYPSSEDDNTSGLPVDDTYRQALTDLCRESDWTVEGSPDYCGVYEHLVKLLPTTGLAPTAVSSDDTAEFAWARARVVFSGAGWCNWKAVVSRLLDLYPDCPFLPTETKEEWETHLDAAHRACGWPVTTAHLDWRALGWIFDDEDNNPGPWHRIVALLHVIKHTRSAPECVIVTYGGRAIKLALDASSSCLGQWVKQRQSLLRALGCRGSDHLFTKAVVAVLHDITVPYLLPAEHLSQVSPLAQVGPWSTLVPDPTHRTGFYQTGLRLDGVWVANRGRVTPYTGTAYDTVRFAWNVGDPGEYANQRRELLRVIPDRYEEAWPSDTFCDAFPNLIGMDAAYRVWLDLPIFASLLRSDVPGLGREYPLLAFLPENPTEEDSTSQGKTLAAQSYARVMVPGIPSLGSPDSSSAPDSRALAHELETYGTLCLDEWHPPRSGAHLLAHANLQALITGASVTAGRALQNSGRAQLRHSIVVSAKALDFQADMVNRTLSFYLRTLTEAEQDRGGIVEDLATGRTSMQMRLGALAIMLEHKLAEAMRTQPFVKIPGFRFDTHARLAAMLYRMRTGETDVTPLARALAEMRHRHRIHTEEAEEAGTVDALADGHRTRIRASALFESLDPMQLDHALGVLERIQAESHRPWNTAKDLLVAVMEARQFGTLQGMLPTIQSGRRTVSDRTIVRALAADLNDRRPPEGGTVVFPAADVMVEYGPRRGNSWTYRVQRIGSEDQSDA